MPSFKWLFRLAIVLSFAWIAFSQYQPTIAPSDGTPGAPETALNSALTKLKSLQTTLHEKAAANIITELRNRGIPIDANASSANLESLSTLAKTAVANARSQLVTKLGQSSDPNVQSLLTQISQLDEQQVVSQLQAKVQRLIQETGSPNSGPPRPANQE
jgi:hypothetical protein